MTAFILPPVNAEAINTSSARFGIPEGAFTSSSVPESPPASYVGSVPYAINALVSTGAAGGPIAVWQSLSNGNVGHTPASNPLWWKQAGETYSDWNSATSWSEGMRVVRSTAGVHAVFQRLAPGGIDAVDPEADPTKWARVGATNRWAMFDMLSAAPTVAVSPLTFTLSPGRVSGIALMAADVGNVHVTMQDGADLIYESFGSFDSTPVENWDDYFFAEFSTRSNVVLLDLPTYSAGQIRVEITSDSGTITLGKVVVGAGQALGETLSAPKVRQKNYSAPQRDAYGELTGIKKGKSTTLVSSQFMTDKAIVLRAKAALDAARSTPCVFLGLLDGVGAYAELLTFLAICTDSEVDLAYPERCPISAEFEGI